MKLTIRPLTPDLWPALEDLFGEKGACNGCWCMYWRLGGTYRKRPREENKEAFREVVKRGPPPGLLAFDGDVAVGWCQLTPRDTLPWLDRAWRLKRVDDVPVWSLSCFYVRKALDMPQPSRAPDSGQLLAAYHLARSCATISRHRAMSLDHETPKPLPEDRLETLIPSVRLLR